MQIRGVPHLTPGLFLKKEEGSLSAWLEQHGVKSCSLFGYGRIALLYGLKLLDYGRDNNVLLPAYICDITAEPFYELGIQTRFYRVLTNLQPDITDIKTRIDRKTKAIMVVNYFGFPQRLDEIQNICKEHGLTLIEDNAHGFLSRKNSQLLGTFGDIGFSSIWKVLPAPNGAALFVNNEQLIKKSQELSQIEASREDFRQAIPYKYILSSLLSYLEARYKFPSRYFRNAYNKFSVKEERDVVQDYQRTKARISGLSLKVLHRMNPEEVISRRRANYKFWSDRLGGKRGVTVIFKDLAEGVCPQLFPIIADDVDGLAEKLLSKGIYVDHWPWLPREVEDNREYATANSITEHLLVLPVHQNTDPHHLEKATRGLNLP